MSTDSLDEVLLALPFYLLANSTGHVPAPPAFQGYEEHFVKQIAPRTARYFFAFRAGEFSNRKLRVKNCMEAIFNTHPSNRA